ncbi:MAG: hypothetical protein U9R25_19595 [Chloroflexota bacterium]|nr:hypothetical protein [Chloroflexota bacterium]
MRQRRYYGLAFFLVLAAAVLGATMARRLVPAVQVPRLDAVATAGDMLRDLDIDAFLPRFPAPERPSSAPDPVTEEKQAVVPPGEPVFTAIPSDQAPLDVAQGNEPERTIASEPATVTPAPPTPTLEAPELSAVAFPFTKDGLVHHSSENCSGASIKGTVRALDGAPLSGVRLWRYDQWGNEQVVETKAGELDRGQYDFPLGDTPNVHYIQIVDGAGAIISPVVEVHHRDGVEADAACHVVDWRRQ